MSLYKGVKQRLAYGNAAGTVLFKSTPWKSCYSNKPLQMVQCFIYLDALDIHLIDAFRLRNMRLRTKRNKTSGLIQTYPNSFFPQEAVDINIIGTLCLILN